MFLSFIIVEAAEAEGTPSLKLGAQQYDGSLWYREVTCKTVEAGGAKTVATYTTDGSTPDHNSPVYKDPIKCYNSQTIKFQAYYDWDGTGVALEDNICDGAENEISVNFSFDAPSIAAEGANVAITSPYEGAKNFYSLNGGEATEGSSFTLTESATVSAYSEIVNGTYARFTTKSTTQDVYVLNPIKSSKTITATGDVVLDEVATETSTTGEVFKIENGAIDADKMDFFVKNPEFSLVQDEAYQADGKEVYIKMNNTNITFLVAADDVVDVKVTTSKNSCKTLNPDNDESVTTDRKNFVNVSGTTYGNDDVTAENGNIIEFTLKGGKDVSSNDEEGNVTTTFEAADTYYTFQKYSGTGNILIASIEFTYKGTVTGISNVKTAAERTNNGAIYNLAGQKVNKGYKGLVIMNGKKYLNK